MGSIKRVLQNFIIKPERVFLAIALVFGLTSLFLMPILATPDENHHFQVEYTIFSSNHGVSKDLVLNEDIVLKTVQGIGYEDFYTKKTQADNDGVAINTNDRAFGSSRASVYDIMRLPQALGILVGRLVYPTLATMVLLGRFFNLAVFVVALYFIIKKVRYGKWAFVFIACLPMMIQQAASLSYDSTNLVIIFAWVAFCINLYAQGSSINRKQMLLGIILAILLLLSKRNNILLFGLLLGMPTRFITTTPLYQKFKSLRYWKPLTAVLVCIGLVVAVMAGYIIGRSVLDGAPFIPKRLALVLFNTFIWGDLTLADVSLKGAVGMFSNFYYGLPLWSVVIALVVLAIILLQDKIPKISRRFGLVSGGLFLLSILFISIAMYYNWAIKPVRLGPNALVTDGIQGRYFTPLLILLIPAFAYLQKFIKVTVPSKFTIPVLATSTTVFLLSFYLVLTWHYFWK